jgi:hypothetical protein
MPCAVRLTLSSVHGTLWVIGDTHMPQPRKNEQADRMYALYQEGYSLAQVALA